MRKPEMKMQTIDDIGSYTIQNIFRNSVEKFPSQPALSVVGKTPMTYSEYYFFERCDYYEKCKNLLCKW